MAEGNSISGQEGNSQETYNANSKVCWSWDSQHKIMGATQAQMKVTKGCSKPTLRNINKIIQLGDVVLIASQTSRRSSQIHIAEVMDYNGIDRQVQVLHIRKTGMLYVWP